MSETTVTTKLSLSDLDALRATIRREAERVDQMEIGPERLQLAFRLNRLADIFSIDVRDLKL